MKKIWITWEHHRRTTGLVAALGDVKLYELQLDAIRPVRYAVLILRTWLLLIREAPDLVFVQNPSIVLALFMTTIGKWFAGRVVIDSHNEGLRPFHDRYNRVLSVYRYIQRQADITIVTNENLAAVVRENRGRAVILPDRIPHLSQPRKVKLKGKVNIVFICTFEKDEPYREVIDSARHIDPDTHIYITGRYQKAPAEVIGQAASNVTFTGFLSEQDYADLLHSCNAVMDLTLMEDCLVCGAYEAVELERPMILSDTKALQRFFHAGAIYTANNAPSIARAISQMPKEEKRLQTEVHRLKTSLNRDWEQRFQKLRTLIG